MRFFLTLFFVLTSGGPVFADYIFSISANQQENVGQGTAISFDVKVGLPSLSEPYGVKAFTMFFDVTPDGKGLPSNLGAVTVSNYLNGFSTAGTNPDTGLNALLTTSNFDFSVNAESSNATAVPVSPAEPLTLFRLTIDTGTAAPGQYTVHFRDDPIGDGTSLRGTYAPMTGEGSLGSVASGSVTSATFTIEAVPEPSAVLFGLLGCALCIFGRCRRRMGSGQP